MEIARRVAAESPVSEISRLSDMVDRVQTTKDQQDSGVTPGVPTGIPGLDQYVSKIRPGEFFVHCGFSGTGKTQSLIRSSIPAYKAGDTVIMNSLEMSADEIWEIYDAEAARLSRKALQSRSLNKDDYGRYEEAAARVKQAQNDIIYTRVMTVDELAAAVDRHKAQTVCVDYVSLMESPRRNEADWARVKDVSQSLKKMAGTMGVRVYAAAQNAKEAAVDGPKEDNISYSSSIFYDCNVMIGWHQTAEMARLNKMQGRLIKNRGGDKGPPGDSGFYEWYEVWRRDTMQFEPWNETHAWDLKSANA